MDKIVEPLKLGDIEFTLDPLSGVIEIYNNHDPDDSAYFIRFSDEQAERIRDWLVRVLGDREGMVPKSELDEANERAAGIYEEGQRFLREANGALRSVYSCLVDRGPALTNWDGLAKRIKALLDKHHGLRIYEDAAAQDESHE